MVTLNLCLTLCLTVCFTVCLIACLTLRLSLGLTLCLTLCLPSRCSCWDTGASATDCEVEAHSAYLNSGGHIGRWNHTEGMDVTDRQLAEHLATSDCDGGHTSVYRSDTNIHHVTEFATSCELLDMKSVTNDVQMAIHAVDRALAVHFKLAVHADHSTKCEVTADIEFAASLLDRETLVVLLAAIQVTAVAQDQRRGFGSSVGSLGSTVVSAVVFACETTVECSSLVSSPPAVRV